MKKADTVPFNKNAIVVCCTSNWLPLSCCTLLSCADQGAGAIADFIIVTTGASKEEIEKVHRHFDACGQCVTVFNEALPACLEILAKSGVNAGTLLRLALDFYVSSDYRTVLYLDSDILALAPVSKVFTCYLNGKSLGAVEDWHSMPGPFWMLIDHPRTIDFAPTDRYFNAGMLLMDWQKVLKKGLLRRSVEIWSGKIEKGDNLFFLDQDARNLAFYSDWRPLPVTMNASSVIVDYFPEDIVLRHFSAHYKPWAKYWMPGLELYKDAYRKLLKNSSWTEFQVEDFSTIDVREMLGLCIRRLDPITRARYQKHVKSGLG